MLGPVLWGVLSSFKTPAAITRFPPELLPYADQLVEVPGFDKPLPVYHVTLDDGAVKTLAQVRRIGLQRQFVDPANPSGDIIKTDLDSAQPVRYIGLALNNYTEPLERFNFLLFFRNSVIVTASATILTLLFNSMMAFALSKYRFPGRDWTFGLFIVTILVPSSVVLAPQFLIVAAFGWLNNLLGVIIPTLATPTGVFLLRQYMITLPDELLEAARVDGATEWFIYWRIILPLSAPAMATLAIFSIMWRWNDFLWPLIVLTRNDNFTIQLALNLFHTEFETQWHYLLAMTVLSMLPVTLMFAFLQRYITTGIASMGLKG